MKCYQLAIIWRATLEGAIANIGDSGKIIQSPIFQSQIFYRTLSVFLKNI